MQLSERDEFSLRIVDRLEPATDDIVDDRETGSLSANYQDGLN